MKRLLLASALLALPHCAHVAPPELRLHAAATRSRDGTRRVWTHVGEARATWPLGSRSFVVPPARRLRPRPSALPDALACVSEPLCSWERRARLRAWRMRGAR
ncbi:MAG: hypothetical protein H6723_06720 [Sandaracinus sp.]|nr:hypothetical protein [Sandaracinus sp.]